MRKQEFICDLCGATIDETRWERRARQLKVRIYVSSQDPVAELECAVQDVLIKYEETYNDCRKAVASGVTNAIQTRLNCGV